MEIFRYDSFENWQNGGQVRYIYKILQASLMTRLTRRRLASCARTGGAIGAGAEEKQQMNPKSAGKRSLTDPTGKGGELLHHQLSKRLTPEMRVSLPPTLLCSPLTSGRMGLLMSISLIAETSRAQRKRLWRRAWLNGRQAKKRRGSRR